MVNGSSNMSVIRQRLACVSLSYFTLLCRLSKHFNKKEPYLNQIPSKHSPIPLYALECCHSTRCQNHALQAWNMPDFAKHHARHNNFFPVSPDIYSQQNDSFMTFRPFCHPFECNKCSFLTFVSFQSDRRLIDWIMCCIPFQHGTSYVKWQSDGKVDCNIMQRKRHLVAVPSTNWWLPSWWCSKCNFVYFLSESMAFIMQILGSCAELHFSHDKRLVLFIAYMF